MKANFKRSLTERSALCLAKGLAWYVMFASCFGVFTVLIEEPDFSERLFASALVASLVALVMLIVSSARGWD